MNKLTLLAALLACALPISLRAAELRGTVTDPSKQPIAGAKVALVNRVGVVVQQVTGANGEFRLEAQDPSGLQLVVTATGFATRTVGASENAIELAIAPRTDSIRVVGSAIDLPTSVQPGSVTVIAAEEIRASNEPLVSELLRQVPGMVLAQSGTRGTVTSLFTRGGDSKYNLVLLNGLPISSFYYGGLFDFAHLPADSIAEIDIARGPQSAVYGSYAISSVVNFLTRSPEDGPALDIVAEGGTHSEHRFSLSGAGMVKNWGLTGSAAQMQDNGPVRNSDYTNEGVYLGLNRHWMKQSVFAFGNYNFNETGEPGPYGSNPKGYFTGLDKISRSRNYTSNYGVHYQADITPRFRQDVFAGFYLNNNGYRSQYGTSNNKDLRVTGEARETFSVTRNWIMAAGFAFEREEVRNTYIASTNSKILLRRDNEGIYWENRFQFGNRLFFNAGVRGEFYQTPFVPGNKNGYPPRPDFPARTYSQAAPKIAGTYILLPGTRLHASFGTGIRPPGGSDLAFTNNPALKPEYSRSYDLGVEQRLLNGKLSLDATWFHNRYKDLIVSLGGSLAKLSQFSTDNVNNARSEGVETSARFRPNSWFSLAGNYTWLQAQFFSLDGAGVAQQYFSPGDRLLRRPKHSGSTMATVQRGRYSVALTGVFRGETKDVEPSYGAFGGIYTNASYQTIGLNLNARVAHNLTAYANVHNLFNRKYEEIYGFPSLRYNMIVGLKWNMRRAQ